ncbi:MAG: hypothetical protein LBK71_07585 [Verrucomicrobiales bacterium]|jgi:hypothetical protein|nr:hypothetical protein [Verrucomicrobiales bacterium]
MKKPADLSIMAARVAAYNQATVSVAKKLYNADGDWIWPQLPAAPRERFWICCSLFPEHEDALANAIIEKTVINTRVEPISGVAHTFDIFHSNTAAQLLRHHAAQLSPSARAKLEALVRESFSVEHGNHSPDLQFHGYNDNMPSEASMGLILGGELLADRPAVACGLWNLRRLRDILYRRGTVSEFNSPTYSALTVHALAEIAEYAADAEARANALAIEQRLWLDLAARFHPEIGTVSGPYSRAYTVNELGHPGCLNSVLWFAIGDAARPSPLELFSGAATRDFILNDWAFFIAQMALFSGACYHVPPSAAALFAGKKYPFHAAATAEVGDGWPDAQARPVRLETYLTRDYTLGTISSSGGGQAHPYFVTYKRREKISSHRDYGSVYQKFLFNDDQPGTPAPSFGPDGTPYSEGGEVYVGSYANTLTVQDGPTALVLNNPVYLHAGRHQSPRQLSRLSDMIICPQLEGGAADEIIVGGVARPKWAGAVKHGDWIGVRRGRLLVAYRPLAFVDAPLTVRISLEKINYHEVVRTEFYHGEPREFTAEQLRLIFSGFVAEHASVDEFPSLAAFVASLAAAQFTDYYWIMRRTRYRRPAFASRAALEMELSSSPGGFTSRYAVINGQQLKFDTPVAIDGVNNGELPILSEPWQSIPPHFPWPKMEMIWGKGIIGDREA